MSDETAEESARLYCCGGYWCRSRGGEATLASFVGLIPEKGVTLQEVSCLGACEKGPNLILQTNDHRLLELNGVSEITRVNSVLEELLDVRVPKRGLQSLTFNLAANRHLQNNEIDEAIRNYDLALIVDYIPQEGVLRTLRSEALLMRASKHRANLEAAALDVDSPLRRKMRRVLMLATVVNIPVGAPNHFLWGKMVGEILKEEEDGKK